MTKKFARIAMLAAGVTLAMTGMAGPASATAAASCGPGGPVCVYWDNELRDSIFPINPGQCWPTAGVYNTLSNGSRIPQRMWEGRNCTGRSEVVDPNHVRWVAWVNQSVGGL